ncbi:hypothetical protein ACMWEF_001846 [Campylobacter jejuni]
MKDFTYDELVDCVENFDPRIELLKEGHRAQSILIEKFLMIL